MGTLRIVDYAAKGNVVRLFLGTDEQARDAWGDDWDDRYCTDPVYDRYVSAYKDLSFGYDMVVATADDMIDIGQITKEELKKRMAPVVIVCHEDDLSACWGNSFYSLMGSDNPNIKKWYIGDEVEV